MELCSKEIVENIKHEPEESFVIVLPPAEPELASTSSMRPMETQESRELEDAMPAFIGNVKHEPEEHFELVLLKEENHLSDDIENVPLESTKNTKASPKRLSKNAHVCCFCQLTFSFEVDKVKHESTSHKKGSQWKCTLCSYITTERNYLKSHCESHFKKLSCEVCHHKFARIDLLQKHQISHHSGAVVAKPIKKLIEGNGRFSCDLCSSTFASPAGVRKHKKFVHTKLECHCEVCDKSFKNRISLKRHMQIHVKAPCSICGHMMATHRMKIHLAQHTFARKFECALCEKAFSSATYLNKHNVRVHTSADFQCDYCNKVFRHKDIAKSHILNHIKTPCRKCGKLVGKPYINQHMKWKCLK